MLWGAEVQIPEKEWYLQVGETGSEEMEWTRTLTYSLYIIDTDPGAGNVCCIERDTAVGVV